MTRRPQGRIRGMRNLLFFSVALLLVGAGSVAAQDARRTYARTVSGGVSLGAYQAGHLYVEHETLKRSSALERSVVTGASAGAANGLLSVVSGCLPPNDNPTRDLGFRTWTSLGYEELAQSDEVGATHAFSRSVLSRSFSELAEIWRSGLPETCDVLFGASVTRLEAVPTPVHDSLRLPRLTERIGVRIQGRGTGRAPYVENVLGPSPFPHVTLPFGQSVAQDLRQLRSLVFASAAFPGAFEPVHLRYCLSAGNQARCRHPTHSGYFVDGGVLDNNPLGFALLLSSRVAATDQRPIFSYLDPDLRMYPVRSEGRVRAPSSLLDLLGGLTAEFVETSRAQGLMSLAEHEAVLVRRLHVSRRRFPTMSELLLAFMGFFEREFRVFDFYLGMFDAYQDAEVLSERFGFDEGQTVLSTLHPSLLDRDAEVPAEWKRFTCLAGWLGSGDEAWQRTCDASELRDFRILVQVTLDRLYAECFDEQPDPRHAHCREAARGRPVPRVIPWSGAERSDRRLDGEDDLGHTLRLLGVYGFEFHDLGLTRDASRFGRVHLRRELLGITEQLANAQPERSDRLLIGTMGRLAANAIEYEPPKNFGYVAVGNQVELGGSFLPFDWNRSWLRLNLAVRLDGLRTIVDGRDTSLRLTLAGGPEAQLLLWASALLSPSVGVRVGYRWGVEDVFGAERCESATTNDRAQHCSQVVLHGYLAFSVLDRVRIQVGATFFPQRPTFGNHRPELDLAIGYEFF